MKISGGFAHRPPRISFLFTLNFSPIYIPPIYQHSPDFYSLQRKFQKISWGLRLHTPSYILSAYIQLLPLIYPSYQHSPDPKISPQFSANVKNFPGGFAPRPLTSPSCLHSTSPPYISFLSIFTRPQDFSSLPRKYQKFSWGLCPQTHPLLYLSC